MQWLRHKASRVVGSRTVLDQAEPEEAGAVAAYVVRTGNDSKEVLSRKCKVGIAIGKQEIRLITHQLAELPPESENMMTCYISL